MRSPVVTQRVDGRAVTLRQTHDLAFLGRWGRVFRVLDQQDSGNLCFGIEDAGRRVFVKYAGAATLRFDGEIAAAVDALRRAEEVYRDLEHPTLVRLTDAVEVSAGFALVFGWVEAVPLGRQYERAHELAALSIASRVDAVQQILDFSEHAASRGWVAVDLYDGSVLVDPATGRVTLCDLDIYARAPLQNTMGRMWGSDRFMAPEEHQLGSALDEVTNLVALGSLAHSFLGDDTTKSRSAWRGSAAQWAIAERARHPVRAERWTSIAAMAAAWRSASGSERA